jgi:uncharacterized membrane protein
MAGATMSEELAPARPAMAADPNLLTPVLSPRLASLARIGLLRRRHQGEPVRGVDRALVILGAVVTIWCAVFIHLVRLRHNRFNTFDLDLAMHDQTIWLMAHRGHGFVTVRGIAALGIHSSFAYWLLAPFYWFGAGPNFINMIQVLSLAAPAFALFLLARDRMRSSWHALPVGLVWLTHPSTQFLVWETFHPDAMALPWLAFAYLYASRGRWRAYWICTVMALLWKEDVALAVVMLGLVMFIWKQRRRALITVVLGLVWFVATVTVMAPAITGHGSHTGTFYGELGSSSTEVVVNIVRKPDVVMQRLDDNNALGYANRVNEPFGWASLLSPVNLLMGLPQSAINLLSNTYFIYDPRYHYVALPLLAAGIAMAEGLGRIKARGVRVALLAIVLLCGVRATDTHGVAPGGALYRKGYWPLVDVPRNASLSEAVHIPPSDASVAATYFLVGHLSHREEVYTFPNPWQPVNWGVNGEGQHSPDVVDWLVLDLTKLEPRHRAIYDDLVERGVFAVVFDRDEVVVARRVRADTVP